MLSVDLHTHSAASYDGRDPVDDLLAQAADAGLDGIAVTDHDEIAASLEAAERAKSHGLIGIPGLEVTSAAGHVLALGVDELIPEGMPFEETIEAIHDQGGLAVVPHPYQELRSGVLANISPDQLTIADAIEVYNSRLLTGRANRQAAAFSRRENLPTTAGSDAHISEMVGRAVTKVDPKTRSVDDVLNEIRQGRSEIEGRRTPWRISIQQAAGGIRRRVSHRLPSLTSG